MKVLSLSLGTEERPRIDTIKNFRLIWMFSQGISIGMVTVPGWWFFEIERLSRWK